MNWINRLLRHGKLYRDLSDEIHAHIEERTDDLIHGGMSPGDAVAKARREFGNVTQIEERGREPWQWPRLESILSDVRYALRQCRRQPSFTLVAVLILGIGIGANVAVFSVINKILFEPLPFRAPERMVWIVNRDIPALTGRTWPVAAYEAFTHMETLEDISTYEAFFARSSYKLTGSGEPDRVAGVMIPANFFPFLGVKPMLGRTFTEDECKLHGPGAVILSYSLWQRRYSSDPRVIGTQLVVNDRAATIVGVMADSFDFGAVFAPGIHIDVYMPAPFEELRNWGNTMAIIGRLKPGQTTGTAQAEARTIVDNYRHQLGDFTTPEDKTIIKPFRESIIGGMRQPMLMLWGAVGIVLLTVCVNLSNLLLARAATRRKEMALRGALGAGWGRLARQLLTESFVLSLFGGTLGIALAYAAVAYVRGFDGLSIPLLRNAEVDATALAIAVGVTFLTAIVLGLAPAIGIAKGNLGAALKESGRGSTEDREHRVVRSALVVSEVALACVLLVGAGLLMRSFLHVLDVNLGFRTDRTYALRVDAGADIKTDDQFRAYMGNLLAVVRVVPGVEAVSISDALPFDSNRSWGVSTTELERRGGGLVKIVGPGLLETMQTPVIAGREFTDFDDANHEPVAMINETLAAELYPDRDPLLGVLKIAGKDRRVVGIVADVHHLSVEESSGPEFYLPILQMATMSPSLVVRTGPPFRDVAPGIKEALAKVAPDLPTSVFRPLEHIVDRAISPRRFLVDLLTAFAAVALALAAIGIYGVISYSVTRRTSEIGIRMALGASAVGIRAGIVGETMRLALAGVGLGAIAAVALSSLLSSMLFGVSASDPWTYGGAVAILLLVAAAAGFIPAFRASRISPMSALRAD